MNPLVPRESVGERRREIVAMLYSSIEVTVVDLARQLAVSPMTIHHDLQALETQGVVSRVHGGAVLAAPDTQHPQFPARPAHATPANQAIAEAATALIGDREAVIIDAGSATLELARVLRRRSGATIVTPSPHIAAELSNVPHVRAMLTGGHLRPHEMNLAGHCAERSFADVTCCTAFISTAGIDVERGITEDDPDRAQAKKAAIGATHRRIVLADTTRCGHVAPISVAPLAVIDVLVTDADLTSPIVRELNKNGTEIIHVPTTGVRSADRPLPLGRGSTVA